MDDPRVDGRTNNHFHTYLSQDEIGIPVILSQGEEKKGGKRSSI